MEPRGRDLMSLIAILAIGALAAAGIAFSRPLERQTVKELPYEHEGSFSYSAPAPEGIYDASEVVAGEPIFRALIDSFDVQFDYAFLSKAPVTGSGSAHLQAELRSDNGWKRTFELQPSVAFDGPAATLNGHVDLDELQRVIDRVQAETGIEARQYTLTIQPDVMIVASVGGQAVREQFAPFISFQMNAQQLQLMRTSAEDENVLQQGAGGLANQVVSEPNTLPLPIIELELGTARTASLIAFGLLMLAGSVLALQTLRVRAIGESDRLAAQYGARLVAVRSQLAAGSHAAIDVASGSDFQRLIEHHDGPIFQDGATFFIDFEGQRFRHCTVPEAATPLADEPRNVIPIQQHRRRQYAISQLLFDRKGRAQRV
jgi:hypothetical protein